MDTLITGKEASKKLLQGVNKVANAVKGTLGPNARTVIIQREDTFPLILNDGVTIAKAVNDPDPYVQMGIDLIKEVASQAQHKSGDGTTTATLLAQALCNIGYDAIHRGEDAVGLTNAIKEEAEIIIDKLLEETIPVTDDKDMLKNVAIIASNNDEDLGNLIAEVMDKVGSEGAIAVEAGSGFDTTYNIESGLEVQSGAVSPYFTQNLVNSNVLLTSDRLDNFESLVPALELSMKAGRGLMIFCSDYNPAMLPNILINVVQGKISACIVKTAGMGQGQQDWLQDIQSVTGGHMFSKILGDNILEVKENQLGFVLKADCTKDTTMLLTEKDTRDEKHIDKLYQQLDDSDNNWEKQTLTRRIARLTDGVASIKVGANTEIELRERKERIDDAVNAVRAAQRNGVIAGGGVLLRHFGEQSTLEIIRETFATPEETLLDNAGILQYPKIDYDEGADLGFDMKEKGVYDPVDVTINSIRSAVSIAVLVLLSDALISLPADKFISKEV